MTEPGKPPPRDRRYVIVMPTRDEESYLPNTLDAISAQTILPVECVIVDDGSSDGTGAIAEAAAEAHAWIRVVHREDRGERKVGPGVIDAFYAGYDALSIIDFTYVCKMDGDVTIEPGYFESILVEMEADHSLGGASGKTFSPVGDTLVEERIIDEMVAGQVHFWRKECWEEIGGFVREVMWDGIDFHRARMFGWKTRSFRHENLLIVHHRLMGSSYRSVYHGRLRWGRGQWFMGTHPLYIIASGVFRMRERPYVAGGALIVAGYFWAMVRGVKRYDDPWFRKRLHNWQLSRLGLGFLSRRVE